MKERGMTFTPWKAAWIASLKPGAVIQTRRIIKWPEWANPEDHLPHLKRTGGIALYVDGRPVKKFSCPYGLGRRLYVREAYRFHKYNDAKKPSQVNPATDQCGVWFEGDGSPPSWAGKYRPAMFMPKVFHRSGLLVLSVRVERVQDITYEDILAEGWSPSKNASASIAATVLASWLKCECDDARAWFRNLWDSFYGKTKNAWDENPFVFVITAEKE